MTQTSSMRRRAGSGSAAGSRAARDDVRPRSSVPARVKTLPANLAIRMTVMGIIVVLLAVAALVVVTPAKVMIPLATVLMLGFAIGGVAVLTDRHRSRARMMGAPVPSSLSAVWWRLPSRSAAHDPTTRDGSMHAKEQIG
jgi:hypothetical protein